MNGLTRVPGLLYGGDYNPEQWPEDVWADDVRLMKEAGVNLVTVGVFSWARLQPGPDAFDFGWLDRLLDLLDAHGIAADLATATASPPAWLVRAHPETLPVTADGVRLEFGSRQHYCPSSPVYRAAAARLARRIAERYRDHPAVVLWHVHNEYGDHVAECFCAESAADFRGWLRERYGDLAALNRAWATESWSQRYGRWDEIEPPRTAPGPLNPTQSLDWRRFCSAALLACYLAEKAVLDEAGGGIPVTTNFMSMFKPLDYWAWAAREDVVSDDAYPDPADPAAHVGAAMAYDLMRSLKGGRPWLLMEQAPSAVSWRPVNVPKPPALSRLWSLQAVARGADGVLHFQWRASRAGAEKFHSALLPHRGTGSPQWARTVALGRDLARLAEVAGARLAADVAVVLDWDSWWALELDEHPSSRLRLKELVLSWYGAAHARNVAVDFVRPGADLGRYRLVLLPNLYLASDATAAWLTSYVAGGGRLVCGFFSGVVDEHDHVHPGGGLAPLRDALGVVVDEYWPVPDGASVDVAFGSRVVPATLWSELLEARAAEPAAVYGGGPLAGRPAVTRNAHGAGRAWYVGCHLGERVGLVLEEAFADAGVRPVLDVPAGVEATRRDGPGASYLFLLNHRADEAEAPVPDGVDLLSGAAVRGALRLAPLGAAVLRTARHDHPER
ncbi:beta-galactosidase [Actinomadura chibensis]|uniref:Beta-galactosidase n=1 Tax=Actinomadura chibensis TaxID=392828 RepID=A0A5D0NBS1_9ACTN|nr:beta-galactosidase [Actinomadura chibensis]TYB41890.1 beta-galactosidase [Actinomadura chibensis]